MSRYCEALNRPGSPAREHPWGEWQVVVLRSSHLEHGQVYSNDHCMSVRCCTVCGELERKEL